MKALTALAMIITVVAWSVRVEGKEIVGHWTGEVETELGQMEISLTLTLRDGAYAGRFTTFHGDWPVTEVVEREGQWTVTMTSPYGPARATGRIKADTFSGEWIVPGAPGQFALRRASTPPKDSPAPAGDSAQAARDLVILDVTVLTLETGTPLPRRSVVIKDGRIVRIADAATFRPGSNDQIIDGRGRYVMPGLIDLHVHTEALELPMFLAAGVTTIREMNGSPAHLRLRSEQAAGHRIGPDVFVAGPLLAGQKFPWRHRLISAPDDGEREVREQAAAGFDYIKVYDGLSADAYARIMRTAKELSIPAVGHIPASVGLRGVLAAGQRGIEHLEKIVMAVDSSFSTDTYAAVAREIKAAGVTVSPTLAPHELMMRIERGEMDILTARPEMRFVPSETRRLWDQLAAGLHRSSGSDYSKRFFAAQQQLLRALHAQGVPLILGTDSGNLLQIPGYGVHDELRLATESGMSALEAIRTATTAPARFLGRQDLGRVAVGARANLVLLERNPLTDIANSRSVAGVVIAGRWQSREALESGMMSQPR